MNVKLMRGNHHQDTRRGTQFLYWWPYPVSSTKPGNTILILFSESVVKPMCLAFICIIF